MYNTPTSDRLQAAQLIAKHTANAGLRAEQNIRAYLRTIGHPTLDVSQFENMMLDIDCRHAVLGVPISIKMQNMAVHTGRLCFETRRFNMLRAFDTHQQYYDTSNPLYRELESTTPDEFWEPSWYEYGKADWYIIGAGENIYKVKVSKLKDYVERVGWDDYKEHVSSRHRLQHYGRKYTDYKVGLLYMSELLENKIMTTIK